MLTNFRITKQFIHRYIIIIIIIEVNDVQ